MSTPAEDEAHWTAMIADATFINLQPSGTVQIFRGADCDELLHTIEGEAAQAFANWLTATLTKHNGVPGFHGRKAHSGYIT